jgi:hypothetical protein
MVRRLAVGGDASSARVDGTARSQRSTRESRRVLPGPLLLLAPRRHAPEGPLPYSGEVSDSGPITQHRAERILAYMFVGIVGLSILAFIAVMIGTFAGVGENDGFSQGIWPIVLTLPLIGLPLGFLLLIALLIINGVRRARESRSGSS